MFGQNSVKGSSFKISVHMEPIDGYHMEDSKLDWYIKVFIDGNNSKSIIILKNECIRETIDSYIVPIDTSKLGAGRYMITLTVKIPDLDFPEGFRTDIKTIFTGVTIDAK